VLKTNKVECAARCFLGNDVKEKRTRSRNLPSHISMGKNTKGFHGNGVGVKKKLPLYIWGGGDDEVVSICRGCQVEALLCAKLQSKMPMNWGLDGMQGPNNAKTRCRQGECKMKTMPSCGYGSPSFPQKQGVAKLLLG